LAGRLEDLDDDHATAAAWTWRTGIGWWSGFFSLSRCRHREQLPGKGDIGLAAGAGEQAVVTDTVEALRQNMKQEATDELVGAERHGALAVGTIAAIVLVAKGDAGLVERDQPAVRDGDAVGIARQIGEDRFRPGEGRLGVDNPCDRRSPGKENGNVT